MTGLVPFQVRADSPLIPSILRLIQQEFAFMDSRIDPPSSMHRLSVAAITEHCSSGEVWVIGERPYACVFFGKKADCLYLGKLAVAADKRGRGYAQDLVALAQRRAHRLGFATIELETRIELLENREIFQHLGFKKVCEAAHRGFDRPTYIVMHKTI